MKTHKSATFRSVFPAACVLISLFFHSSSLRGQTVEWQLDPGQATAMAKEQNKLVLLHFSASWCHPCKTLETFVFSNAQVQRSMAENVIAVKLTWTNFRKLSKSMVSVEFPLMSRSRPTAESSRDVRVRLRQAATTT